MDRYETFRRVGNSKSCPFCGAPITSDKCEYCGSILVDVSCIKKDEPFYLKIIDKNGEVFIARVKLERLQKCSSWPEALYADNRVIARCCETVISMDFVVV